MLPAVGLAIWSEEETIRNGMALSVADWRSSSMVGFLDLMLEVESLNDPCFSLRSPGIYYCYLTPICHYSPCIFWYAGDGGADGSSLRENRCRRIERAHRIDQQQERDYRQQELSCSFLHHFSVLRSVL